jgi:imidazolonepropionase-like amidohydrolase
MTPMSALMTATGNAAKHLELDDLGLVAVGKRASLLVLDANPLTDIRNTRAIHAVYLNGRLIDRDAIAASQPN